jgi:hypothetical protein
MHRPLTCRIVVRGELPTHWASLFTGPFTHLVTTPAPDGTALVGDLPDQTALHAALTRIRDLGLELVSLTTDVRSDRPLSDGK